jgi:hypothetical protein
MVLVAGTSAASTPAACTGGNCVYLPLDITPELLIISNVEINQPPSRFEDDLYIEGELSATTGTAVYSVTLEVRSYDSQGTLLAAVTGSPKLVATLPGQPNPFYFWLGINEVYGLARYDVRVLELSRTHPRTFLPVRVTVTSYEHDGQKLNLAGTLTNDNAVPLENIRGVAWSRRGDQEPTTSTFAPQLAPFETITFSTSIDIPCTIQCDQIPYKIVAQGVMP